MGVHGYFSRHFLCFFFCFILTLCLVDPVWHHSSKNRVLLFAGLERVLSIAIPLGDFGRLCMVCDCDASLHLDRVTKNSMCSNKMPRYSFL